jgi:hypothetical protein
MLADLDESLRVLLERDLAGHGFDDVEIAFEAPLEEWSAKRPAGAINLFLYGLREATERRPVEWQTQRVNGQTHELRPPLRVDASYAVTAWAPAVADEHRLLSQVLAVLYAYPELPKNVLAGDLGDESAQPYPLATRLVQPDHPATLHLWSSLGGQHKVSLDYVVTLSCEAGTSFQRGPEVGTQTVRTRDSAGGAESALELHRVGGTVRDADGVPMADVWVTLPDRGVWTTSGSDGRFRFESLSAGAYRCVARGVDGAELESELTVPGQGADLVLGTQAERRRTTT